MAPIEGPKPENPEQYLIQIYTIVQNMDSKLTGVCKAVDEHSDRIRQLEDWRLQSTAKETGMLSIVRPVTTPLIAAVIATLVSILASNTFVR